MQYLRGLSALRQDPAWLSKVGVASLLMLSGSCIPIVGQVSMLGWCSLMLRRAVSGEDAPLPPLSLDFDYLGKLLGLGFKTFLARLLWSLPIVVLVVPFVFCVYAGAGAAVFSLQRGGDGEGVGLVLLGVLAAAFLLLSIVLLFATLPLHVAMLRSELTEDLGAAIRFGEVMSMTKLLFRELVVGSVVMGALNLAGVLFGLATLYLGLFPAMIVTTILSTYWRAELYRVYLEKGGAPLPIGPLAVAGTPAS